MLGKLKKNQLFSAALLVTISLALIFIFDNYIDSTISVNRLTRAIAIESINSSNCIACHTNEGIIAASVGEDDGGHGSEGG